jgi:hypothetical protein
MNWNNEKLNEIQAIENILFHSTNHDGSLKTALIHQTSEWIDSNKPKDKVHISPFKVELDKQVELVAYYIECGYIFDTAVRMIGKNTSDFRKQLTDTHNHIIQAARKQRKINKLKNK